MKRQILPYGLLVLGITFLSIIACNPLDYFIVTRSSDHAPTPAVNVAGATAVSQPAPAIVPPTRARTLPMPFTPSPEGPQVGWKSFTSTKHHYTVSYPASWTINVQAFEWGEPDREPEGVYMRPPNAMWAMVQIYALKGTPSIQGDENCTQNLFWKGVPACSLSLPEDPVPHQLLIFQKGESYFHVEGWYTDQQQLAVFEEIVKSFQFSQ